MGINRNIYLENPYISAVFFVIKAFKQSRKSSPVQNDNYNPLCEYILKVDDVQKTYIASVNTRAAARAIKRAYQHDKGVKIKITQFVYDSDRFKGGKIVSTRLVR